MSAEEQPALSLCKDSTLAGVVDLALGVSREANSEARILIVKSLVLEVRLGSYPLGPFPNKIVYKSERTSQYWDALTPLPVSSDTFQLPTGDLSWRIVYQSS